MVMFGCDLRACRFASAQLDIACISLSPALPRMSCSVGLMISILVEVNPIEKTANTTESTTKPRVLQDTPSHVPLPCQILEGLVAMITNSISTTPPKDQKLTMYCCFISSQNTRHMFFLRARLWFLDVIPSSLEDLTSMFLRFVGSMLT